MRGGKAKYVEGDWQPKRIVVTRVRVSAARQRVAELRKYREPRKMRHRTARTNMILVEGI